MQLKGLWAAQASLFCSIYETTQQEMAEKEVISQTAYSQMVKPGGRLRRVTIEKIAGALGIDVALLVD